MNSALKPLSQPGVPQPGGQASPAKANVASANHAVGLPQGAQNSLHHASNNLVGQNLIHHVPNTPQLPPHAAPSMAPVSANMAQMAQNMSHHGNLSHVNPLLVVSPSKAPSTSAPLSLVQDKANVSQPLALTRTTDKKEPDSSAQANGTIESPKAGSNTPAALKPQNPETNKDKQDIAKTSPSTTKPPEKSGNTPSTPQKIEASNSVGQADGPVQPKVAMANEAPEKSPSKPTELKPAQTADVAPTQSDNKPVPESANDSQCQEKPETPQKQEASSTETVKEAPAKVEDKEAVKVEKPVEATNEEVKEAKVETPKQEEVEKPQKSEEKVEDKKVETKPVKSEIKVTPKSTLKLATVTPPMRKRRQVSDKSDGATPAKKPSEGDSTPDARTKRNRTKVQLYQSPTPEIAMATKLSASAGRSTPTKQNDDKLIVFYKNEYLAVRNAEGSFYVCQAMQNVYRTTRKIKIRWLSQDKSDSTGETYKPDFYDVTDMECVLTTLSVSRAGSGGAQRLAAGERARATSILQRALRAELGEHAAAVPVTEEHPDGLDLSLYTDESQLDKKSRKRNSSKSSPRTKPEDTSARSDAAKESALGGKRAKGVARRAAASKVGIVQRIYRHTATAVTEKVKTKSPPAKRTPAKVAKVDTPVVTPRKGRRAVKERKSTPIVPTPSTSTGKSTRTPRKPPAKK
ncbi:uncharacterized protein [Epargyreus clarus]|uniref:uncharacterized protein isoform X2 n=1 Tax=Epargyreus clarus TaxID=520877 RepID=UPI003C2F9B53